MPNYNVTVSTEFVLTVSAENSEEAAALCSLNLFETTNLKETAEDIEDVTFQIVNVEEISPPLPNNSGEYTSLREHYSSLNQSNSVNESSSNNNYSRFTKGYNPLTSF